jgi:hypothetical protein
MAILPMRTRFARHFGLKLSLRGADARRPGPAAMSQPVSYSEPTTLAGYIAGHCAGAGAAGADPVENPEGSPCGACAQ